MTADVFRLFDPSEFEEEKMQATERVQARLGSGDGRVAMSAQDIAEAAQAGRIDTLLLSKTADNSKAGGRAEDPLDAALFETLRNGGEVRIFAADEMQGDVGAAALLRY